MQEPLSHGPGADAESAHDAIKSDDALWTSLAFAGMQHDERGNLIESRRCPRCGSIISRPLSMRTASEFYEHQAALQARSKAALEAARRLLGLRRKKDSDEIHPSDETSPQPSDGPLSQLSAEPSPPPIDKPPSDSSDVPSPPIDKPPPRTVVISLRIEGTVQLPAPIEAPEPHASRAYDEPEPSEPLPPGPPEDSWPRKATEFGLALRRTREYAELTRAELAVISTVADSTIRNVETNRHGLTAANRRKLIEAMARRGYPRPIGQG